ncbi:MAG TPA: hypothetical protein VHT68_21460 [Pseudolabrys sp.]|jgi:hypothetical protein|nr:hypothetical protein [Pseudolabrys sp.]
MSLNRHILAAAIALIVTVVPSAWYLGSRPSDDELNDTLRSLGYLPITPPSNLMNLGSLYYVDPNVKFFKTLCGVEKDDLKDAVIDSPSTSTLADELHSGTYSIGIKLDAGTVGSGHGGAGDKFVTKVHYSLTDVHLYEIALGTNHKIYSKLMAQDDCNKAVLDYIEAGGYVCQGQQILEATVEYDLKLEGGRTVDTGLQTEAGAVAKALKVATHTDTNAELDEKSGRLVTGTALKYGIAMNPTCLTPLNGRFQRVLPRSSLDRFMNFVKFRLIEPILPGA